MLDSPLYLSTFIRDSMVVTHVYHICSVLFMDFQTWVGLIIFDMLDFYIILAMTLLSPYHVVLNFNVKTMTL